MIFKNEQSQVNPSIHKEGKHHHSIHSTQKPYSQLNYQKVCPFRSSSLDLKEH